MFCNVLTRTYTKMRLQTSIDNFSFVAHTFWFEEWTDEELCKPIQCFSKVTTLDVKVKYRLQKCHSGTLVERRSLAGELSLSCVRPVADG